MNIDQHYDIPAFEQYQVVDRRTGRSVADFATEDQALAFKEVQTNPESYAINPVVRDDEDWEPIYHSEQWE